MSFLLAGARSAMKNSVMKQALSPAAERNNPIAMAPEMRMAKTQKFNPGQP